MVNQNCLRYKLTGFLRRCFFFLLAAQISPRNKPIGWLQNRKNGYVVSRFICTPENIDSTSVYIILLKTTLNQIIEIEHILKIGILSQVFYRSRHQIAALVKTAR